MRNKRAASPKETVSAALWLSAQLILVCFLFFWPQGGGFGWPRTVFSYDDKGLDGLLRHGEFSSLPLNINLAIYIGASLVLLAMLSLLSARKTNS